MYTDTHIPKAFLLFVKSTPLDFAAQQMYTHPPSPQADLASYFLLLIVLLLSSLPLEQLNNRLFYPLLVKCYFFKQQQQKCSIPKEVHVSSLTSHSCVA